ncbi:MAG TPA: DUF6618 family protein [Clostridia bacterium]|nr:DUF6618 family protein [Clostridia bacterium]
MSTAYKEVSKGVTESIPLSFHCISHIDESPQEWDGIIGNIVCHGSHYEINIQSRSGITIIVGKYTCGGFLSIPSYGVGSELASFGDYFWNLEQLLQVTNPVDAVTIAQALRVLHQKCIL